MLMSGSIFRQRRLCELGFSIKFKLKKTSLKSDLHLGVVGRRTLKSRGLLVEAMPSVMKASAEVSPWALREVDRLN